MNKDKIAILVDSGSDVPSELVERYGIYVVPLQVIYGDVVYADGVDIAPAEIYARLEEAIPKTSLPSGDMIINTLNKIKDDGFERVLAITISSGLSGTCSFVQMLGNDFEGLEVFTVDTKNIGIGSGITAISAAENIEKGLSWEQVKEAALNNVSKTKVFFCVPTLKYLRKGGRIGLVSSIIGENLNVKPVISCNEEGIYYNAAMARGRQNSFRKAIELAEKFIASSSSQAYNIMVAHGNALEEAMVIKEQITERLKNYKSVLIGQITPALVVHTGPGLIGICIQLL